MKEQIAVTSFYCFVNISNPEMLIAKLLYIAKKKLVKGTILLANEGFNGTLSGNQEDVNMVLDKLYELTSAKNVNVKTNFCDKQPFSRVKIKLKKEIVALKAGDLDVEELKGEYIKPEDWDQFINQQDVIMIDTRNDYEVEAGTFKGAINPHTESFRDFPNWADQNHELLAGKKIAMFCTGGIRCEKSTAFLKHKGYDNVYHLEGGILQYLDDTKNRSGNWQGECFVFDDRGAVTSELMPAEGYWVERGQTAKSMVEIAKGNKH